MKQLIFDKSSGIKAVSWLSSLIASLDDKKYVIEIKQYRKGRSLNANAYCWSLCNELANVLRMDKDEVYINMLKAYGQSEIISVRSDIDVRGYFKYYDEFGKGYVNNKEFTHYKVYKGSSEYDTREMSILIDGIIQECAAQGIETMTPGELQLLKESWAA